MAISRVFVALLGCLVLAGGGCRKEGERVSYPSFAYQAAWQHEIEPHRSTIPIAGVEFGQSYPISLKLVVSPAGNVLDINVTAAESEAMRLWPSIEPEVRAWKFTPFEINGKPDTVQVDESLELVPLERLPKDHVAAPVVTPRSKVAISLQRTTCFGACPAYEVTVGTDGIVFNGTEFVAAKGRHTGSVDPDDVRKLAQRFVAADFYSMDAKYVGSVNDTPRHVISVTIDGRTKEVFESVGQRVGMPSVIVELEEEVDRLAHTDRWVRGPR